MVYFDVPLILPLVGNYSDVCEDIMLGAFGVEKPHQLQKEAFSHQFDMMKESRVNKQPHFPSILSVPTGGGKSLLRDICAVSIGGVTLCVSSLFSLSADQITNFFQKRKDRSRSNQSIMYVHPQLSNLLMINCRLILLSSINHEFQTIQVLLNEIIDKNRIYSFVFSLTKLIYFFNLSYFSVMNSST